MATTAKPEVNWKTEELIIFNTCRIMKRLFSILMLIAATAVAFSSCNKVEIITPSDHHVVLRAGNPEAKLDTRTVMNGTTVYWNVGDKIGVSDGSKSNISFTSTLEEPAKVSDFESTSSVTGDLYAYSPYTTNGVTSSACVKIDIPSIQNPTVSSFDGSADVLVSKKFTVNEVTTVANLEFTRATSVVKVVLKDTESKLSDEKLKSLSVTSDAVDISGRAYLSFAEQSLTSIYYNNSKTVTAEFDSDDRFVINGSNPVLLSVFPVTLANSSKLTIKAETETKTIEKVITLPQDIILSPGKITTLNVSISSSNIIDTPNGLALPIADYYSWNEATTDQSADLASKITTINDDIGNAYLDKAEKVYAGAGNTLKFGTGSAAGYFKTVSLDLSSAFDIYISTKQYGSDDGSIEVYVDEDVVKTIDPTPTMGETKIVCSAATKTSTITVKTTGKRAYVGEFVVVVKDGAKPTPKPVIVSSAPAAVAADATTVEIPYIIKHPVSGVNLTAEIAADATWITAADVSSDKVTLTVTKQADDASEDRFGKITLKYEGAAEIIVTVSQKAPVSTGTGTETITGSFASSNETLSLTTSSGITIVQAKGTGSSAVNASYNTPSTLRIYKGHTLTFSGRTINRIEIKVNGTYYGNSLIADCGTLTPTTTSDGTIIWEGSSESITITNAATASNTQLRTKEIIVTYE